MESQVLGRNINVQSVCAPRFINKTLGHFAFWLKLLLLCGFGPLCTVLGAGLHTAGNTLSVEGTADNVVTDTRKVLYTAAANHNHGVLLKVMADAGDISSDFITIGQANTSDLTQSGVRLLRGGRTHCRADAALLGRAEVGLLVLERVQALLHSRSRALVGHLFSSFSYQLVKGWHNFPPFLK